MNRKQVIINGNNFETLEEFYSEMDNVFTKDLDWTTGHNLDAFNDLLRGGFGVYEYKEPILLIWENSAKSKIDLSSLKENKTIYEILLSIISEHDHIQFIEN
ncbi:barstar family protein [Ferruginibacter albus]|uniref:barstar family protein n=1 Tax=Ferruginibacter albus TaxID=2875540 RepID=UPI001CC5696E|nr:barstar family protein [Ferruginibacter albus]UAY52441.1 barstar family protein [Ferruginibacter albus]